MRRISASLLVTLALLLAFSAEIFAQAVKGAVAADAPPPPVTFGGLIPGLSTEAELRARLGEPRFENSWYAYKLLYPARDRAGHFDSVHLQSRESDGRGRIGTIEAATIPAGFASVKDILARLGAPEFTLELSRQTVLDYSASGLRFVTASSGETIGVAHFPVRPPRVHEGGRRFLSLRHLPQGAQARPAIAPRLDGLRAGAVEVDLTPRAEWLGALAKKGEFRVHDPIKARCAVLARGDLEIAIVGADLFAMSKSEVDPIESALREEGIDHLIIAMSHNHAAPDTVGIYGFYPEGYIEHIQRRVREGVLAARRALKPVSRWIAGSDELLMHGARVEGLIRNARNPALVHPQIAVMQAVGEDERPIVTFVHFACHVEGLASGVLESSADFPGYMCDALARDIGGHAVFLNGALGGMVSGDTKARTHEEAKLAGERFASEARRILETAVEPQSMRLEIERHRVELPMTNPKFIIFMKLANRRELHRGRVVSEISHLRIGDAELLTFPGELLPEIGFEILEEMVGAYPRMLVGLTNDELGYFIPGYDFNSDAYEEGMSVGPAAGAMLREQSIRILRRERDPRRYGGKSAVAR